MVSFVPRWFSGDINLCFYRADLCIISGDGQTVSIYEYQTPSVISSSLGKVSTKNYISLFLLFIFLGTYAIASNAKITASDSTLVRISTCVFG